MIIEPIIITTPSNENFCSVSDEDEYHVCATTTGDDACGSIGETCSLLEIKNENTPNSTYTTPFTDGGCGLTVDDVYESITHNDDLNIRAFCTPNPCGGADATHVCITGAMDTQTSHGMMSKNIFLQGNYACQTINKTCTELESSLDENGPWGDLLPSSNTICTDILSEAVLNGTIQGYFINDIAHYPYVIRAVCE